MVLPNFLYIGPDKAGSTWMFDVLRQHRNCFIPQAKDVYYFDRYYDLGDAWYKKLFESAREEQYVIGEMSHDYLYSEAAAERIARDIPNAKLIVNLREPVERSFSHYLYLRRSGLVRTPLLEALEDWTEIVDKSLYGKHLTRYFELFPHDQIGIFQFEDLRSDSRAFAHSIFRYLGLPETETVNFEQVALPAAQARSFALARIAKAGAQTARKLGLANLVGKVKHGKAASMLYKPFDSGDKPQITPEEHMRLTSLFEEDRDRLRNLLQEQDIPRWLSQSGASRCAS